MPSRRFPDRREGERVTLWFARCTCGFTSDMWPEKNHAQRAGDVHLKTQTHLCEVGIRVSRTWRKTGAPEVAAALARGHAARG